MHAETLEPDEVDILQSVADIEALITFEAECLPSSSRLVLGGFSQGGTMSVLTGTGRSFGL